MQHGAERPLGHLLLQDALTVPVGIAGVDHERQAGHAGGGNVRAKAARLRLRRAVVVEIVEPGLAQRDDLRVPGQLDQLFGRDAVFLVGVMRMGADRAIDVGKALRDGEQPAEPLTRVEIVTMRPMPASAARATMASRSAAKSGKSRWQWLSTSIA